MDKFNFKKIRLMKGQVSLVLNKEINFLKEAILQCGAALNQNLEMDQLKASILIGQ